MAKQESKRSRRPNRSKAEIAQAAVDTQRQRLEKKKDRLRSLQLEIETLMVEIEHDEARLVYLEANPDLPKPAPVKAAG